MAEDHFFKMDVHVDKFENKTISQTNDHWDDVNWNLGYRHFSDESGDELLFYVYVTEYPDMLNLREGNVVFLIDNVKQIKLTGSSLPEPAEHGWNERALYRITKEQIKEICDAKTLEIRISGRTVSKTFKGYPFKLFTQCFYNQFFDQNEYKEAMGRYDRWWEERIAEGKRQDRINWWKRNWGWVFVPLDLFLTMVLSAFIANAILRRDGDWVYWLIFVIILSGLLYSSYAFIKSLGRKK